MKIISENNLNMNLLNLSLNKSGIYLITNLVNGKKYVGSSVVLKRRFKEYSNPLYITRNLKRGNSKLLNALLKYGSLNFEFKILETIEFLPSKTKSKILYGRYRVRVPCPAGTKQGWREGPRRLYHTCSTYPTGGYQIC